jgi:hypothetical protein
LWEEQVPPTAPFKKLATNSRWKTLCQKPIEAFVVPPTAPFKKQKIEYIS